MSDEEDEVKLTEALINWFESQEVSPSAVLMAMVRLTGVMIAELATTEADMVDGVTRANSALLTTALKAFEKKKERK